MNTAKFGLGPICWSDGCYGNRKPTWTPTPAPSTPAVGPSSGEAEGKLASRVYGRSELVERFKIVWSELILPKERLRPREAWGSGRPGEFITGL